MLGVIVQGPLLAGQRCPCQTGVLRLSITRVMQNVMNLQQLLPSLPYVLIRAITIPALQRWRLVISFSSMFSTTSFHYWAKFSNSEGAPPSHLPLLPPRKGKKTLDTREILQLEAPFWNILFYRNMLFPTNPFLLFISIQLAFLLQNNTYQEIVLLQISFFCYFLPSSSVYTQ